MRKNLFTIPYFGDILDVQNRMGRLGKEGVFT